MRVLKKEKRIQKSIAMNPTELRELRELADTLELSDSECIRIALKELKESKKLKEVV